MRIWFLHMEIPNEHEASHQRWWRQMEERVVAHPGAGRVAVARLRFESGMLRGVDFAATRRAPSAEVRRGMR
jgi:hypothetical protein